jgi:hypothetical protein
MCAQVGNQQSRGVVTAWVQTNAVRSLRHQRRDLHQSTYLVPLKRSGLILLSDVHPEPDQTVENVVDRRWRHATWPNRLAGQS